jgi:hypothetical protein
MYRFLRRFIDFSDIYAEHGVLRVGIDDLGRYKVPVLNLEDAAI